MDSENTTVELVKFNAWDFIIKFNMLKGVCFLSVMSVKIFKIENKFCNWGMVVGFVCKSKLSLGCQTFILHTITKYIRYICVYFILIIRLDKFYHLDQVMFVYTRRLTFLPCFKIQLFRFGNITTKTFHLF